MNLRLWCAGFIVASGLYVGGCETGPAIAPPPPGYGDQGLISPSKSPSKAGKDSGQQKTSEANAAGIETGSAEEGKAKAAIPMPFREITARKLMPNKSTKGSYTEAANEQKGKVYAYSYEKTADGLILTIEGVRRSYYRWAKDGALWTYRDDDLKENVRVTYDPGILILPKELKKKPEVKGEAKVEVYSLSSGEKRASGSMKYEVVAIWESKLDLPAGTFDCYIVREKRDLNLDLAMVTVTLDTGYAAGIGEVMQAEWQSQKTLDLFIKNSSRRLVKSK
ncbi:hypothetical protein [Poriferisphaera sp. WC338]|uniref:hypothetical protein n=1 Tax=Poriferisphaera sp. WC338 TaxID=3425129 RepID=UPI003D8179C2